MAGTTRLELATSAVTGQRSNQLNYVPALGTDKASPLKNGTEVSAGKGSQWAIWMLNGGQIGVKSRASPALKMRGMTGLWQPDGFRR